MSLAILLLPSNLQKIGVKNRHFHFNLALSGFDYCYLRDFSDFFDNKTIDLAFQFLLSRNHIGY